jgi:hypothetical protein
MENEQAKPVTMRVRVGDSEMEVTGPLEFVERKIAEFLQKAPAGDARAQESTSVPTVSARKAQSPAQFFKSCNPRSDTARALVAAYFLEKHKNAENVTAAEIREIIREAKVPPPTNPSESVNQNIRKGLLMAAGERDNRRAFVLTSDGEAAVEDMQQKRD